VDQDALKAIGRIAVRRAQEIAQGPVATETVGSRRIAESLPESLAEPTIEASPTFSFEVVSVDSKGNITDIMAQPPNPHKPSLQSVQIRGCCV
jgi:hypothetical protein